MPQCPRCHGAGFKLVQVAFGYDRVRVQCRACGGYGQIKGQQMTPLQRKQLAQILLKEGEDGWRVEHTDFNVIDAWRPILSNHFVDGSKWRYRAIHIERLPKRTPLPIEHYRRGMEVLIDSDTSAWLVLRADFVKVSKITNWRWPNETEWHPAFTETVEEREVERLEVDGL